MKRLIMRPPTSPRVCAGGALWAKAVLLTAVTAHTRGVLLLLLLYVCIMGGLGLGMG